MAFSVSRRFKVPHWDELGRSQAEVLIEHSLERIAVTNEPGKLIFRTFTTDYS